MSEAGNSAGRKIGSFEILSHQSLPSTNEEARRLAADGAPEGTLVLAERQTSGRGRRGRSWVSPPGNLYFSIVLRPRVDVADAPQVSFVAAVALAQSLSHFLDERFEVSCKWPNDVLIDGAKAAGILIERDGGALILGVGVNVESAPQDTPYPATSLAAAAGGGISAGDVLEKFCKTFNKWYTRWTNEGFSPVREVWLTWAQGLGGEIEVRLEKETLRGRFEGLDEIGALLLVTPDGTREITAGDVFFLNDR